MQPDDDHLVGSNPASLTEVLNESHGAGGFAEHRSLSTVLQALHRTSVEKLLEVQQNDDQLHEQQENMRESMCNMTTSSTMDATQLLECAVQYINHYFQLRQLLISQIETAKQLIVRDVPSDYCLDLVYERIFKSLDLQLHLWLNSELTPLFTSSPLIDSILTQSDSGDSTLEFDTLECLSANDEVSKRLLALALSLVEEIASCLFHCLIESHQWAVATLPVHSCTHNLWLQSLIYRTNRAVQLLNSRNPSETDHVPLCTTTLKFIQSWVTKSQNGDDHDDCVMSDTGIMQQSLNLFLWKILWSNHIRDSTSHHQTTRNEDPPQHYFKEIEMLDVVWRFLSITFSTRTLIESISKILLKVGKKVQHHYKTRNSRVDELPTYHRNDESSTSESSLNTDCHHQASHHHDSYKIDSQRANRCNHHHAGTSAKDRNGGNDECKLGSFSCHPTRPFPSRVIPFLYFKVSHIVVLFGMLIFNFVKDRDEDEKDKEIETTLYNHIDYCIQSGNPRLLSLLERHEEKEMLKTLEKEFAHLAESYLQCYCSHLPSWVVSHQSQQSELQPHSPAFSTSSTLYSPSLSPVSGGHLSTLHLGLLIDLCECLVTCARWDLIRESVNSTVMILLSTEDAEVQRFNNNNEVAMMHDMFCKSTKSDKTVKRSASSRRRTVHQEAEQQNKEGTLHCCEQSLQLSNFSSFHHQLFKLQQLLRLFEVILGFPVVELDIEQVRDKHRLLLQQCDSVSLTSSSSSSLLDCFTVSDNVIVKSLHNDLSYLQSLLLAQFKFFHESSTQVGGQLSETNLWKERKKGEEENRSSHDTTTNTKTTTSNNNSRKGRISEGFGTRSNSVMKEPQLLLSVWSVLSRRLVAELNRLVIEECICQTVMNEDEATHKPHRYDIPTREGLDEDDVCSVAQGMSPYTKQLFHKLNCRKTLVTSGFPRVKPNVAKKQSVWLELIDPHFSRAKRRMFLRRLLSNFFDFLPRDYLEMPQLEFALKLQQVALLQDPLLVVDGNCTKGHSVVADMAHNSQCIHSSLQQRAPVLSFALPPIIGCWNSKSTPSISLSMSSTSTEQSGVHPCRCYQLVLMWVVQQYGQIETFYEACKDTVAQQLLLLFTTSQSRSSSSVLPASEMAPSPRMAPRSEREIPNYVTTHLKTNEIAANLVARLFQFFKILQTRTQRLTHHSSVIHAERQSRKKENRDRDFRSRDETPDEELNGGGGIPKTLMCRIAKILANMSGMLVDGDLSVKFINIKLTEKQEQPRLSSGVALRGNDRDGEFIWRDNNNSNNNNNENWRIKSCSSPNVPNIPSAVVDTRSTDALRTPTENSLHQKIHASDNTFRFDNQKQNSDDNRSSNFSSTSNRVALSQEVPNLQGVPNLGQDGWGDEACPSSSVLLISEQFWPGWVAKNQLRMNRLTINRRDDLTCSSDEEETSSWMRLSKTDILNDKILPDDLRKPLCEIIQQYESRCPGKTLMLLSELLRFEISIKVVQPKESYDRLDELQTSDENADERNPDRDHSPTIDTQILDIEGVVDMPDNKSTVDSNTSSGVRRVSKIHHDQSHCNGGRSNDGHSRYLNQPLPASSKKRRSSDVVSIDQPNPSLPTSTLTSCLPNLQFSSSFWSLTLFEFVILRLLLEETNRLGGWFPSSSIYNDDENVDMVFTILRRKDSNSKLLNFLSREDVGKWMQKFKPIIDSTFQRQ